MCEGCLRDAELLRRLAQERGHRVTVPAGMMPTAAELERHARRFGPEGVEELASELGVKVKLERPKVTRKRAKGPTLKERVAAHVAEGRGVELIAELENLSPSRARRIIEEVGE